MNETIGTKIAEVEAMVERAYQPGTPEYDEWVMRIDLCKGANPESSGKEILDLIAAMKTTLTIALFDEEKPEE